MSWASSDSAERTLLWVQAHSSSPASSASRSRTNPQQDEKKEKERREEAQQTPSRMLKHKRNHITSSALAGAELQPGSQHTSVQVKPSTQVPPKPYPKPSSSMVPEPSVLESGRREQTRRGSVDQGHSRQPSRPYIPQDFVQPSMQSQQPPKPQYQRSSSQSRPQPTRSQSLTRPAQDPLQTTARTNVQPQSAAHSKSASQVPVYSYQKPPLSPQDQKSAQYTYAQPPQSPVDAQAPPKPTYVKPPKIPTPVLAAAQLPAFPQGQPGSGYPYRMTPVQPQPVPAAAYRPGAVPVAAPAPTSPPPLVGTPMNPKKSRPISQRRRPSLSGTVFEPPPPDKTHTSQNSIHSQHRRDGSKEYGNSYGSSYDKHSYDRRYDGSYGKQYGHGHGHGHGHGQEPSAVYVGKDERGLADPGRDRGRHGGAAAYGRDDKGVVDKERDCDRADRRARRRAASESHR